MEIRHYLVRYHRSNVLKWKHVEGFCDTIKKCMTGNDSVLVTVEVEATEGGSNGSSRSEKIHNKMVDPREKLGCSWNSSWDVVSKIKYLQSDVCRTKVPYNFSCASDPIIF